MSEKAKSLRPRVGSETYTTKVATSGTGKDKTAGTEANTSKSTASGAVRDKPAVIMDATYDSVGKSQLEQFEERILAKFEARLELLERRISDMLDARIAKFVSRLDGLEQRIADLQCNHTTLQLNVDDMKRVQRLSDVIIRGIPRKPNESPLQIVRNIAEVVNHPLSPFVDAFRLNSGGRTSGLNSKNGASLHSPPLIVRLSSPNECRALFASIKGHGGLKLKELQGFSSEGIVSVRESLTSSNNSLLREALRLRKSGSLHSAFSRNGIIFVKWNSVDRPVRICNRDDLRIPSPTLANSRAGANST